MLLKTLIEKVPDDKKRNLLLTGGGMLALLAGRKIEAATMFARGMQGLEQQWRDAHPEFQGGIRERWQHAEDFYEATHTNDTNRFLHIVGIPVIVGVSSAVVHVGRRLCRWVGPELRRPRGLREGCTGVRR
jgi:hypothetical protein